MRKKSTYKGIFLMVGLLLTARLAGQALQRDVVASAGTSATASGIHLSYTLGEPVASTLSAGNLVLTQGFQQPDGYNFVPTQELPPGMELTIFPNPASSEIYVIQQGSKKLPLVRLVFVDVLGREWPVFDRKSGAGTPDRFFIGHLSPGYYLIKLAFAERDLTIVRPVIVTE